ncbi:MAG: asparagine synthase (glutamine-hydrolyzing) [Acidobacteria bacterium]|nr:asparagine synthase (glutamine-hydrolyzing) [Acidobacteriota bacterium]
MCGIVGIVGELPRAEASAVVRRMNESIFHRGPDEGGEWADDGFAFGMRRLSIIDLAGGHQPMWDEPTRTGVVFNGEIYNYRALRERLEARGVTGWATRSDTEVVLRTLVEDGEAGIHTWNGMFAVAAWDARAKKLTLVRDRMGVKPLYYFWDGKNFLFASEIKALLASGLVARRVNRQAVWDYLTFRYVPEPETVWEDVRKLPPGHLLRFGRGGEPQVVRYWESDVVADEREPRDDAEVEREFAALFEDAVNLRLVASDVPVGVFLSGGLDSSAIAAAAVEQGHQNFHTFSVGFDDGGDDDELPFARRVAEHVGARHHEVVVNQKQFLDELPEVVRAADEPLADLTLVPLLAVSRLARRDVKVVLSGEGSDEILAGYNLDQMEREWDRVRAIQGRVPRAVLASGAVLSKIGRARGVGQKFEKLAGVPLAEWNRRALPHMTRYFDQGEKENLWRGESHADSDRILEAQYAAARSNDPLQQLLAVYQKSWLVEDLLMKADKMTMATSLEARTPFLDFRLVEWANRQPNRVKVRRERSGLYTTKSVLRRFCATRLPREILTRPKKGFPVPAYRWLREGLDSWARDTLLGAESRLARAFDREAVSRTVEDARQGIGDARHRVWLLLILETWLRVWDAQLA